MKMYCSKKETSHINIQLKYNIYFEEMVLWLKKFKNICCRLSSSFER